MNTQKPLMAHFLSTHLYGITAYEYSLGRSNVEVVKQMLVAGIKVIQYREKERKLDVMYEECLAIRALTQDAGATFIVNDHVDLAMMVKADGVHIGQNDLPPLEVRALIGEEMILGLSTHLPEQAKRAEALGVVDYIGVGPIFATQTKKDVCAPVGFDYLDYVVSNISLPFVAIGGIKEHNLNDVLGHGARMVALVTQIVGALDIASKVEEINAIVKKSTSL